jgi:hypothetical protein
VFKRIRFPYWLLYAVFFLNLPLDYVGEDYPKELKVSLQPTPYEVGAEAFKTPKQVKGFLKRKKVSDEFVVDHESLLISASHIFEIPYAFQTCLLYSESKFKANAISPVGARGVAQFTQETYFFITKILRVGLKNLDDLSENRIAFKYEEDPKSRYILFNKILFSELAIKWQAYLRNNGIDNFPLKRSHFKLLVYNPKYAIGLSSLYLKYLKERLRYRLKDQYNYEEGPLNPNVYLTLAGAYNQGIERTWRLSARNSKVELQHIVAHQSRIRETRKYIKSINSCMSPES